MTPAHFFPQPKFPHPSHTQIPCLLQARKPHSLPLTNDPLVDFQWALDSHGQQIILPKGTYIDSEYIQAVPEADLGIKNIIESIEAKIKRDVVIAIIDSGLDYHLKEIQNGIAYNPAECDKSGSTYKNPFRPKKDLDGNGYKGDCVGWNVIPNGKDSNGNNNPMDDVGHATHLSGAIAAEKNNGLGISGVSNKLKVLPIKVMHRKLEKAERDQARDVDGHSFTNRVAQGIAYAIVRNVDVINLSLGWPSSMDHPPIRQAIQRAIDKGIIVVAAAGNNKNNRPIAPCNYPGVLCVGSSRADKKVSGFSNFGAHVDLLAPGEPILSLFPPSDYNQSTSSTFNLPGYEVKSGTSQSAAYVSAISALLKVALNADGDEVKARLFSTAENIPSDEGQYFRNGLIHLERAYQAPPQPVLRPEFKNMELVELDPLTHQFHFPLKIKNYWTPSQKFTVKVRSLSPHVTVHITQSLKALEKGASHTIHITGIVAKKGSHMAKLSVTLTHGRESKEYPFEFILATKLTRHQHVVKVPINLDEELKQILNKVPNMAPSPILNITDFKRQSPTPEYFSQSQSEEGIRFKIWQQVEGTYQMTREILIPSKERQDRISFHRDDFEGDGQPEYIIRTGYKKIQLVGTKEQEQAIIQYTFLDSQFNPYYGPQHSTWEFNSTHNNFLILKQRIDKLQFLAFSPPISSTWNRKIWVPVFVQATSLPKIDKNQSPLGRPNPWRVPHINFLIPEVSPSGQVIVRQRVFGSYQRKKQLEHELNLPWRHRFNFLSLLVPPPLDNPASSIHPSKVRALMSLVTRKSTDYYVLTLRGKTLPGPNERDFIDYQIAPLQSSEGEVFKLELNEFHSSIKVTPSSYRFYHSDIFFALFNERMARTALLDPHTLFIHKKSELKQENFKDRIQRFVQSFEMDDRLYTFLESNSFLILLKTHGYNQTTLSRVPLTRFSFVPGYVLHESVQPIVVWNKDRWNPALYVNSSHITSQYVYSWIFDGERLFSPVELSITLPPHCRSQDISPWGQGFAYIFLCSNGSDNSGWQFQFLPVMLSDH